MKNFLSEAAKYLAKRRRHDTWMRVVGGLACVVVFCTTYALILPAITLEKNPVTYCGLEEHIHTEECWEDVLICGHEEGELPDKAESEKPVQNEAPEASEPVSKEGSQEQTEEIPTEPEKILVCTQEESEGHTHTDDCYKEENVLTCTQEENEGHTHTDDCYKEEELLVCEEEEGENHTHTEECYETEKTLICEQEESEGHTHTDDCYETEKTLTCEQEESEGHTHTDDCYEIRESGIEKPENTDSADDGEEPEEGGNDLPENDGDAESADGEKTAGHVHTAECYERRLICGLEEHTHEESCYVDLEADVETAEDWEATIPELTGVWADDLIAVAESQLGYEESKANYVIDENEEHKGYTRYGAWYGQPYDDWCAMFVSFCLNYADIPEKEMPGDASSQSWIEKLSGEAEGYEDYNLYAEAGAYEPVPGDLIFFDHDGDGKADHVGIVAEFSEASLMEKAQIRTIEGNSDDKVQYAAYEPDDETILGYAVLPGEPATLTFEGEDYTVAVSFGTEARIPKGAELLVSEYEKDSDTWKERYAQAAAFYGWDEDKTDSIRLFNIGFYVDGEEVEPAAEVSVTITYTSQKEGTACSVTHFGEETERVAVSSSYVDGEQSVDFTLESFSDIMLLTEEAPSLDLNGKTLAIIQGSHKVAMLSDYINPNADHQLKGETTSFNLQRNEETGLYDIFTDSKAEAEEESAKLADYKIWTFEAVENNNTYYIHTVKGGTTQYLKLGSSGGELSLSSDKSEATPITVTLNTENYAGQVRLSAGEGSAINLYVGNVNNGFGPYNDRGVNEWFYLVDEVKRPEDARGLDGRTFALVCKSNNAAMLAKVQNSRFKAEQADLNRDGDSLYIRVNSEIKKEEFLTWTFQAVYETPGDSDSELLGYYITTTVEETDAETGGLVSKTCYLYIDGTVVGLEEGIHYDTDDEDCSLISVQKGSGDRSDQVRLMNQKNQAVNLYGNAINNGFGGYQVGGGDNEYFYLVEDVRADSYSSKEGLDGGPFALVSGITPGTNHVTPALVQNESGSGTGRGDAELIQTDDSLYVLPVGSTITADMLKNWNFEAVYDETDTDELLGYYITSTVEEIDEETGESASKTYYLYVDGTAVGVREENPYINARGKNCSLITVVEGVGEHEGQVRLLNWGNWAVFWNGSSFVGHLADNSSGEYFYIVSDVRARRDANIVENKASHGGSVINLFDYWTDTQASPDDNRGDNESGINSFSILHFLNQAGTTANGLNNYTKDETVYTGIIKNVLGPDGYPELSEDWQSEGKQSSLAYLFDPENTTASDYREAFPKVTGLLQVDDTGYYYYNSQKNFAELNKETGEFKLYDAWGVYAGGSSPNGQFFPFNNFRQVAEKKSTDPSVNHYFGMNLIARFIQRYGGHTDYERNKETTFGFTGDDDVWIFIDDVLVADLGGIHDAATVNINFVKGIVTVNGEQQTTLLDAFGAAGKVEKNDAGDYVPDPKQWQNIVKDGQTYTTFADNTTHTLKFFYLERGNTDSNLYLQYNLKEIPASSIVKVDQYGDRVPNAEFALYAANKEETADTENTGGKGFIYKYKVDQTEADGSPIYISLSEYPNYTIDTPDTTNAGSSEIRAGTIRVPVDEDTVYTITPIYYGKTDEQGNMKFLNADGMPLGLSELQAMADTPYFILREIVVPDGYRLVSDEVWLYLRDNILYCDNIYSSGAYAAATALITATQYIYLNDSSVTVEQTEEESGMIFSPSVLQDLANERIVTSEQEKVKVHYYDPAADDVTVNGTLFAVVLKYNKGDINDSKNWTPIYGNDINGYLLESVQGTGDNGEITRDDFIRAAIKVAKTMESSEDYSDSVFDLGTSGTMQLTMTDLPGSISTYYSMLLKTWNSMSPDEKSNYPEELTGYLKQNMKYTVAYYWTTGDLEGADAANTFRVNAEEQTENGEILYVGFDRAYGAVIEVPNLVNGLFVQKLDNQDNLIDGAVFAMYKVGQDEGQNEFYYIADDGTGIYLDEDTDGNNRGTAMIGSSNGSKVEYVIDEATGIITVSGDTYHITPVDIQTTNSSSIANEPGTAVFGHRGGSHLKEGKYIVREVSAPDGYVLNPKEIQVLVDKEAIYANAGTDDDGVSVGRGPGYVVSTLSKFASEGEIDNTLTWVYEQLRVSGVTTSFSALKDTSGWKYLKAYEGKGFSAKSTLTDNREEALTTYLKYVGRDGENGSVLFNYVVNNDAERTYPYGNRGTARRLYTSYGWSNYLLYQDTEYGKDRKNTNADYTEISEEISGLFSRSTYIQVADDYNALTITKVDSENTDQTLEGVEFTLKRVRTVAEENSTREVTEYYQNSADPSSWSELAEGATEPVIATDGSGKISLTGLLDGVYTLTETKAHPGYNLLNSPVVFTVKNGLIVASTQDKVTMVEENGKVIGLIIPNSMGYGLPNTGGVGTDRYLYSGLLLMAGAVISGYMLRRRKGRGCKA